MEPRRIQKDPWRSPEGTQEEPRRIQEDPRELEAASLSDPEQLNRLGYIISDLTGSREESNYPQSLLQPRMQGGHKKTQT